MTSCGADQHSRPYSVDAKRLPEFQDVRRWLGELLIEPSQDHEMRPIPSKSEASASSSRSADNSVSPAEVGGLSLEDGLSLGSFERSVSFRKNADLKELGISISRLVDVDAIRSQSLFRIDSMPPPGWRDNGKACRMMDPVLLPRIPPGGMPIGVPQHHAANQHDGHNCRDSHCPFNLGFVMHASPPRLVGQSSSPIDADER